MLRGNDNAAGKEEISEVTLKASHEAKIRELLCNIKANEVRLCSDASKDFIRLLRGNAGGELVRQYVQMSSKCSELLEAWKLQQGKPGLSYIFSLISAILNHPDGKYRPNDREIITISRILDKFARSIIEEHMEDVYKELNSRKWEHRQAALILMTSIVRRGSSLASEVAKRFDFKLPVISKLVDYKKRQVKSSGKQSTRKSFVWFAMSFLETGKPGLLRWVLQLKEMYSHVLRGIGNDDDETVTYILLTLRDRVLVTKSLVPPGLRSVLFGSATLEQLVAISGRNNSGLVAELAHTVLKMVCTDPSNGLMPDTKVHPPLKGNPKRLLGLMKKLKATEVVYHKDLLLAIVNERPSFVSAYLNEFPYNLEDHASPKWFHAAVLAADLISSLPSISFGSFTTQAHYPPSFDSTEVQSIMKCICPRQFSRLVLNKGLLHSDILVKHGTLRVLSEALVLLDTFIFAVGHLSSSGNQTIDRWATLKEEIQNEVRGLLPDPQVLLTLLSSLSGHLKAHGACLKREADAINYLKQCSSQSKKLKADIVDKDTDIIISGLSSETDLALPQDGDETLVSGAVVEPDSEKEYINLFSEIWPCSLPIAAPEDVEIHFRSKLIDCLKIYVRTMPNVLQGSFDFFINLLTDPLSLPINVLRSLLSLLKEYIGYSNHSDAPIRIPQTMYKHLHPFIILLIFSPDLDIRIQSCWLAQAAMLSTGAFDRNMHEVGAWFLFLPGYTGNKPCFDIQSVDVVKNLPSVAISFLSDAISTVGNNLPKYWNLVKSHIYCFRGLNDLSPDFGPLIICVLQKCSRLLNSESGTFILPEKVMIALYASCTIRYLLQTQVDAELLSALVDSILSKGFNGRYCLADSDVSMEWRPLKNLFLFSKRILQQKTCSTIFVDAKTLFSDDPLSNVLSEVKRLTRSGLTGDLTGITKAFCSSIICATPGDIVNNFPLLVTLSYKLQGVPLSLLSSRFFIEQSLLADLSSLWKEFFFSGLEMDVSVFQPEGSSDNAFTSRNHFTYANGHNSSLHFDSSISTSLAFNFFLKLAPFHVLFPAIIYIEDQCLSEFTGIEELLVAKISEWTFDYPASSLHLVLFWFHQIQLSYRMKPLPKLEQLSHICYILIDRMLTQMLVSKTNSDSPDSVGGLPMQHIQEVAETIFRHPVVTVSWSFPLNSGEGPGEECFWDDVDNFLHSSSLIQIHKMDRHVLNVVTRISEFLFSPCKDPTSPATVHNHVNSRLVRMFRAFTQRLFVDLKNKFDLCISSNSWMPLIPTFSALHTLNCFISPVELLEFTHWIFSKFDLNKLAIQKSCKLSILSVACYIAAGAFDVLSNYLQQPVIKRVLCNLLWEIKEENFDVHLFEKIYFRAFDFATRFKLASADLCLLKAVETVSKQKYIQDQKILPLNFIMLRVIGSSPVEMLSHCIQETNETKSKLLFLLTELSPIHLLLSGHLLSCLASKYKLLKGNVMGETSSYALSDVKFVMLLPIAFSYLKSAMKRYGKQSWQNFHILPFYSKILLKGFVDWKKYVSHHIFEVDCGTLFPSSVEELVAVASHSLLGKALHMLQFFFAVSGDTFKVKKRLKVFDSICPLTLLDDGMLNCDISEVKSFSPSESLNLVNRTVAKISFCIMLLFPDATFIWSLPEEPDWNLYVNPLEIVSERLDSSKMFFLNNLVGTWQMLVMKFPSNSSNSGKGNEEDNSKLFKLLEIFLLRTISELSMKMRDVLVSFKSIPFLEQLVRSSLLQRFEDPVTLRAIRSILSSLSEEKSTHVLFLQLLLSHSQFASVIHSLPKLSADSFLGSFFRPMASILRSPALFCTDPTCFNETKDLGLSEVYAKQLEVIKLLRVLLYSCKNSHCCLVSEKDHGINFRDLFLLLLSSYGATLNEIDLEIYYLMCEIESIDGLDFGNFSEVDHLWGFSSLQYREELAQRQNRLSNNLINTEPQEEFRRSLFRESIPIDPKLSITTVLHFPFDRRTSVHESLCLDKSSSDGFKDMSKPVASHVPKLNCYDPIFVLRFSIHSLSMGYIEPIEFAGLGLLAVAFVSIASPDDGVRKLGYETLGRFKNAVEDGQKRKDVMRLRLLSTYVQNGIEEPWQKIPSVISIFAAEASFILLDPSNDLFSTLTNHLMRSSRVDMKCFPLFHACIWSSSANYKTERSWILRLSYAGLKLDDDARIYIRNSILESLLSFFICPLSDYESKELILQVVKKSVQLHKMLRHLVEQCSLISWISSVVSCFSERLCGDRRGYFLKQLAVACEIVNHVISSRNITEWLQKYALEQLMELSSHFHKLLICDLELIKENVTLVERMLQILLATIKLSQKRKIYQPHFSLSVEGLFHIYQVVDASDNTIAGHNTEIALKVILMSTPPAAILDMNPAELSKFVKWAISTSLHSDSALLLNARQSHLYFRSFSENELREHSLLSTLIRWLIASVILWKLSVISNDFILNSLAKPEFENLHSLLEFMKKAPSEESVKDSRCKEILVTAIFYLQQLLGVNCEVLPSVVSALCLLLLSDSSSVTGLDLNSVLDESSYMASLLSRIHCPPEANPAWRWSFYQPWKDLSSNSTNLEKNDEFHACRILLVMIANFLGKASSDLPVLSCQDVENSGALKWESDLLHQINI